MKNRSRVRFSMLRVSWSKHLVLKGLAHGKKSKGTSVYYKGREQVAAGLEELLQTRLVPADRDPPVAEWFE